MKPRTIVFAFIVAIVAHGAVRHLDAQSAQTSSSATAPATGRIEGQVFDSVAMRPLARAQVWIPGTAISALANDNGNFTLDNVPAGRQVVAFSTITLDSLGLGTLGARIEVRAGAAVTMRLASPSKATLWKALCGARARISADSGIVWGTVREAQNGKLVDGASTFFRWYEMRTVDKKIVFDTVSTRVETDSTGTFYACGLPTEIALTSAAVADASASGDVEFSIGTRGLVRVELLVSEDMVAHAAVLTSGRGGAGEPAARGTATLTGVVRDELHRPVPDALVTVSSADTAVRTQKDGSFTLRRLPGGTQGVQVRGLGYSTVTRILDLRANTTSELNFELPLTTTLAVTNVRGHAPPKADVSGYFDRRRMGLGLAFEFASGMYPDAIEALYAAPRAVIAKNSRGIETLTLPYGKTRCEPKIFLDAALTSLAVMRQYPVDRLRAVEVITAKSNVPTQFTSYSQDLCGVVLYWSKSMW